MGQGHRVAVCEQVEDPKLAKGLVKREVVETITPGAVFADDLLMVRAPTTCVRLRPAAKRHAMGIARRLRGGGRSLDG